jgi:hypothetical protein
VNEFNVYNAPFVVGVHGVVCVAIYYPGMTLRLDVAVVALDAPIFSSWLSR